MSELEILLKSFLSSEAENRQQQTREHNAINESIKSISDDLWDMKGCIVKLEATVNNHSSSLNYHDIRISDQEKNLNLIKNDISSVDRKLSETTGEYEIGSLKAKLDERNEKLQQIGESKRHWSRWVATSAVMIAIAAGSALIGFIVRDHEKQSTKNQSSQVAAPQAQDD
jgi:chromosome segregation ATPase